MVCNHNCRIDDNTQRHRNSGHRVYLDTYSKQFVEYNRTKQIDHNSQAYHRQVSEITAHRQHKQKQDGQRQHRTQEYLLHLVTQVLRCIIIEPDGKVIWQIGLKFLHFLLYGLCHLNRIDILQGIDIKRYGIETVDTVV